MEEKIARLAAPAYGIVRRQELLDAGISARQIDRRLAKGALVREHRGVYRAGPPSTEASYMAAVKACGNGAALSGLAAAHRMGLITGPSPLPEVTAPGEHDVDGILTHQSPRIERWTFNGIPTTTVARTLVDIASRLDEDELPRACYQAQVKYRTTPREVEAVLRRRPNSAGAASLRRVLGGDVPTSLSALERRFLPGSRTAAANAKLTPAATPSGATRGATSSRSRSRCWPSCGLCSQARRPGDGAR